MLTSPLQTPYVQHALGSRMPCSTRSRVASVQGVGVARIIEAVLKIAREMESNRVEKCIFADLRPTPALSWM